MRRLGVFLGLLGLFGVCLIAISVWPDDAGDIIIGTPRATSGTAVIYDFYTAKPQGGQVPPGWTTTRVQHYDDGTTKQIMRNLLSTWLGVVNYTSHTLFLTPNCPNETTPTVGRAGYAFRLWPSPEYSSSGMPFGVNLAIGQDLGPRVWNVGVLAVRSDPTATADVPIYDLTSATVRIVGR